MSPPAEAALRIEVPGSGAVSALRSGPADAAWTFVYAPGAGSNLNDPFGAYAATALADEGIACLRFQFPYTEAKRKLPDRVPVLEATWRAALAEVRPACEAHRRRRAVDGRAYRFAGGGAGRGGRCAWPFFAYPLHPPGQPEKRRDAHLPDIAVPSLFCSGDRDTFGDNR